MPVKVEDFFRQEKKKAIVQDGSAQTPTVTEKVCSVHMWSLQWLCGMRRPWPAIAGRKKSRAARKVDGEDRGQQPQ